MGFAETASPFAILLYIYIRCAQKFPTRKKEEERYEPLSLEEGVQPSFYDHEEVFPFQKKRR